MLFLEDCVAGNIYICYHKIGDNLYLHKYLGDDKWSIGTDANKPSNKWEGSYNTPTVFNSVDKVIPLYKVDPLEEGASVIPLKEVLQSLDFNTLDSLQAAKTYYKELGSFSAPAPDIVLTFTNVKELRKDYLYKTISEEVKSKIIARLDGYLSNDGEPSAWTPIVKTKIAKKYKIINCTKDKQLFRELNE